MDKNANFNNLTQIESYFFVTKLQKGSSIKSYTVLLYTHDVRGGGTNDIIIMLS